MNIINYFNSGNYHSLYGGPVPVDDGDAANYTEEAHFIGEENGNDDPCHVPTIEHNAKWAQELTNLSKKQNQPFCAIASEYASAYDSRERYLKSKPFFETATGLALACLGSIALGGSALFLMYRSNGSINKIGTCLLAASVYGLHKVVKKTGLFNSIFGEKIKDLSESCENLKQRNADLAKKASDFHRGLNMEKDSAPKAKGSEKDVLDHKHTVKNQASKGQASASPQLIAPCSPYQNK